MKIIVIFFFTINSSFLIAQLSVTIERTVINNTGTGIWEGVNISRRVPTTFTYRNNSITSVNAMGYMLQAGDENTGININNLDGATITGNKFKWNGTDETSITHALFTGYNINAIIKYNYLENTPMGIIRKSNSMTNTSGGIAYNIVNNPTKVAVVVKAMNNVNIYNNTFYSTRTPGETWRGIIDVYTDYSLDPDASSTGTKIFNNIFYCEAGVPMFNAAGVLKTFTQWQALGYDTHSVVINPSFINYTDFVPGERLDYGTGLGSAWQAGLSLAAVWGKANPDTTNQNGKWQVGARIYNANEGNADERKVIIYPNPARDFFNISIKDITLLPQTIKIIDLAGNIRFTDSIEPNFKNVQIPGNLNTGIYFVILESGSLILYAQKLIINK